MDIEFKLVSNELKIDGHYSRKNAPRIAQSIIDQYPHGGSSCLSYDDSNRMILSRFKFGNSIEDITLELPDGRLTITLAK